VVCGLALCIAQPIEAKSEVASLRGSYRSSDAASFCRT
jgi:hypothetical protein